MIALVIGVSDWDESARFFHDVVGAEVIEGGGRLAFRVGSTKLKVNGLGIDLSVNVARMPVRPGNSDVYFAGMARSRKV